METTALAENVVTNTIPQQFVVGATVTGVLAALLLAHWLLRVLFSKTTAGIERKIYLYPLPVRIWHWVNLAVFLALLFTGVGGWLKLWNMKGTLINAHIVLASVYLFLWIGFVAYNMLGNGKNYKIRPGILTRCVKQGWYYLAGVMRGAKEPFIPSEGDKFNPLQQVAYAFIIYILIPLFILSGMLQMIEPIHGLMIRTHIFVCTFTAVLFAITHIYMVLSNGSIKNMIDGYERYDG